MSELSMREARQALENGWKSARLIYEPLDDNEEDLRWVYNNFHRDSAIYGQAWPYVYSPVNFKAASDETSEWLKRTVLAVKVCVENPDHKNATECHDTGKSTKSDGDAQSGRTSSLIAIGKLSLRAGTLATQHHRGTSMGIQIITSYQGQGYGNEAVRWGLDWAFKFGGFHRVTLECVGYNYRAQRFHERIGFVKEGVQREALWFNGRWYDMISYGMLDSEWKQINESKDTKVAPEVLDDAS